MCDRMPQCEQTDLGLEHRIQQYSQILKRSATRVGQCKDGQSGCCVWHATVDVDTTGMLLSGRFLSAWCSITDLECTNM